MVGNKGLTFADGRQVSYMELAVGLAEMVNVPPPGAEGPADFGHFKATMKEAARLLAFLPDEPVPPGLEDEQPPQVVTDLDPEVEKETRAAYEAVLRGESVKLGIFQISEDFLYTGEKDEKGQPKFNRVVSLVYFDEDDDDNPATESFDGTFPDFVKCLEAHDLFDYFDDGYGDEDDPTDVE